MLIIWKHLKSMLMIKMLSIPISFLRSRNITYCNIYYVVRLTEKIVEIPRSTINKMMKFTLERLLTALAIQLILLSQAGKQQA